MNNDLEQLRHQVEYWKQQRESSAAYERTLRERLQKQLSDSQKREVMLRGLVEQSRGSVKFDLNRYEQLLEISRRVGVEKSAQYIAMDIEANRLSKTIDGIDKALAATDGLDGLILCHAEPVRYIYEFKDYEGRSIWSSNLDHIGQVPTATIPLYRAWEPK